jgi:hypothetical protein
VVEDVCKAHDLKMQGIVQGHTWSTGSYDGLPVVRCTRCGRPQEKGEEHEQKDDLHVPSVDVADRVV